MSKPTTVVWQFRKETFICQILPQACPACRAEGALVGLPPPELKKQPDKTNVVCMPGIGGCNHGFEMELPLGTRLYRRTL